MTLKFVLNQAISRCRFEVSVTGFDWVSNDEKTRWFLVMRLNRAPQDGLNELLRLSNKTVHDFGHPPLYAKSKPPSDVKQPPSSMLGQRLGFKKVTKSSLHSSLSHPKASQDVDLSSSFHISIAWALSAPTQDLVVKLHNASHDYKVMRIGIDTVKIKIGNNVTSVSLASRLDTSNRIIES